MAVWMESNLILQVLIIDSQCVVPVDELFLEKGTVHKQKDFPKQSSRIYNRYCANQSDVNRLKRCSNNWNYLWRKVGGVCFLEMLPDNIRANNYRKVKVKMEMCYH